MEQTKEYEEPKEEDLSPDRDGTIIKSIIVAGEKFNCPTDHSPVKVHAVGSDLNNRVFYDKELEYIMGEGFEQQLPEGVDKALRRINKGEKCRVTLKGRFGYGSQPPPEFRLAANETIIFTLFLKDFEKIKASWELLDEEKLIEAIKFKDRGTKFFSEGKYQLALTKVYNAIVSLLEFARPSKPDEEEGKQLAEKYQQTLIAAWLNIALVNLKIGEKAEAIRNCDKVLEKMPSNVKALYRKAQAQQMFKDFEEAIETYKTVLEFEPENKAAAQQIQECRHQLGILNARQRKKFRGLFDRLANEKQQDDENIGQKMEVA
ncbi:Peptidylprolyl isomerase [Meloidogyne graminicola]|uniref:peptidylprolyl isomerase n=1 Tax=Meloidogyne graminicola TaxID=189291 RepID=A0A8S9ZS34_9BILA|nr:Peptidylprolyl isomerase [Meloidogyne graminicola]